MSCVGKRWKSYSAYKDSGVEWLGMVPEGWEVFSLRRVADSVKTGTTPQGAQDYHFDADGYPWYTPSDFSDELHLTTASRNLSPLGVAEVKIFPPNTVMIVGIGATMGKVGIAQQKSSCNQQINAIEFSPKVNPFFGMYFLATRKTYLHKCGKFTTLPILNQDETKNIIVCLPPLPEQNTITAFLDQQCAQIDSLIEKKQHMLDLLDEKRRAVITQAVTRGLDPTVPMKDSGVEWLGMVPNGWKVGRVAFGYDIMLGKMLQPSPNSEKDIAVPYYRAMNVQWEKIDSDLKVMWATPEEIRTFSVRQGDLLVCEGGEVGRAAIINLPIDEPTIIQNALHRVRAFKDCNVGYLLRLLEHVASADWFSVLCNKSTIAHFTGEKFKALKCPLPPLPEQQTIADYLDAQCAAMDSQRKNVQKSIELLREYRASIIAHAVTGKIDVRDVAPLQ